jgi:vancomycin permeability regulator SanA
MMIWYFIPVIVARVVNAGNVVGIILCALIYFYAGNFQAVNRFLMVEHHPYGWLVYILALVMIIMGISAGSKIYSTTTTKYKHGTLVVLGCKVGSRMLTARIEAARDYIEDHPDTYIVVSGGRGSDEEISEAEYMRGKLVDEGVDSAHIVMEQEADNTYENIHNSEVLMQKKNLSDHMVILSSDFHLYRASLIAKNLKIKYSLVSAKSPWWLYPTYFTREIIAVIKMWL